MKNEFKSLGLQLKEIAELLSVPERTLYSWFNRATPIPSKYDGYISGLKIYHANQKTEDLETEYTKWEADNRALLETQKIKALKELRVAELQNNLALDKLKQKKIRLFKRLHLSKNYPNLLSVELQNTENVISWCNLMFRKSAFDLGDISLAIQKLEEKKVGLAAQTQYWEGIFD